MGCGGSEFGAGSTYRDGYSLGLHTMEAQPQVWRDDKDSAVLAQMFKPFNPDQIKVREIKHGGKNGAPEYRNYFYYIEMRTAQNRFDEVFGPQNWSVEYEFFGASGVKCSITVVLPSGRTITKADCGGITQTKDPSDSEKSGASDAFKRAAVVFGVFRYAYGEGIPEWVRGFMSEDELREIDHHATRDTRIDPRGSGQSYSRQPAQQGDWQSRIPPAGGSGRSPSRPSAPPVQDRPPATGRALWARCQDSGTIDRLKAFADSVAGSNGWPQRVTEYNKDQVDKAYKAVFGSTDHDFVEEYSEEYS